MIRIAPRMTQMCVIVEKNVVIGRSRGSSGIR